MAAEPTDTLHGYRHGDRVRDQRDGMTGTVLLYRLAHQDPTGNWAIDGEVRRDSGVVDQLDDVLPHITRI